MPTILITGAAGQIGTMLRPRLARPGRTLRLLDTAHLTAGAAEEAVRASVTDMAAMTGACRGVSAVIHLGGIAGEDTWDAIRDVNIHGTYVVFEAARRAGVPRVIFASSNHAVGFTPRSAFPVPDYAFPAPDTYYGVSKVAGEALAALYHHRYGLDAICIRILTCSEKPGSVRALSTWLSPGDAGRLFDACLTAPEPGFRVVYGVSANARGGWVSLAEARALGYEPADDAEAYAAEVTASRKEPGPPGPGSQRDPAGQSALGVRADPAVRGDPADQSALGVRGDPAIRGDPAVRGDPAGQSDPADPVLAYLGGEFTLPEFDAEIPPGAG